MVATDTKNEKMDSRTADADQARKIEEKKRRQAESLFKDGVTTQFYVTKYHLAPPPALSARVKHERPGKTPIQSSMYMKIVLLVYLGINMVS